MKEAIPRVWGICRDGSKESKACWVKMNVLLVLGLHCKYVRTTNLIGRSFEEERRRTKMTSGFLTEKSALKLVFSVLIRANKRRQRVNFNALTIARLDIIRNELDLLVKQVEVVSLYDRRSFLQEEWGSASAV